MYLPLYFPLILLVAVLAGQRDQGAARVRARRGVPARSLLEGEGPGADRADSGGAADGARGPAHGGDGRAAAGRDLARQRLGAGQRRGVLPRGRPAEGDHQRRTLLRSHQPARADHAALGAGPARTRRDAGRTRQAQRRHPQHPRLSRPTPGASRSPTSRSSMSTSTRPWSARSRARPRPSACDAPRSSTPKASARPPRAGRSGPSCSAAIRARSSCATCRR